MSYTPSHKECPRPSVPYWSAAGKGGRVVVAYVRESFEVENPTRAYRRTESKRKWKRVGLYCVDCGAFWADRAAYRDAGATVDQGSADPPADGRPGTPAAVTSDGRPSLETR